MQDALRFYEANAGQITINGQNIDSLSLNDLRSNIATVPQDAVIFSANALENQVTGELQENLVAFEAAEKQERLIAGTLLPQAELTFRSALAGYENGKVDFATLLDAQRAIKLARQGQIRARVEQEVRLAEIERMIGEEL